MSPEKMRCFIERCGDGFTAHCVDVDLSASAASAQAARRALDRALEQLCYEVYESGHAPRAPIGFSMRRLARYWAACLRGAWHGQRCDYVFRSPPQLVLGLA